MRELSLLQDTDATTQATDKKLARGQCKQTGNRIGTIGIVRIERELAEADAVEPVEPVGTAEPQPAVVGLGDRSDVRGRAIFRGPRRLLELRDRDVASRGAPGARR